MTREPRIVDAVLRNAYTGPVQDYLERGAFDAMYLFGRMKISQVEITSCVSNEGAFVALISARVQDTLSEMVEYLHAPTFPVHDEPLPKKNA